MARLALLLAVTVICIVFSTCTATRPTCQGDQLECAVSKQCIPINWKCDGDIDCGENDNTDEINCPPVTCTSDEFICKSDHKCIPKRWQCDGEPDCNDESDELESECANKTCDADEFKCKDNTCISLTWKCDGSPDCPDESDEQDCQSTCSGDEFQCTDGRCIHQTWYCDGDQDCFDGSDEKSCVASTCQLGEFKCTDSPKCIEHRWRCDGDFDCPDHSDEMNCENITSSDTICASVDFMCKQTLECIHGGWVCDGDVDCEDGTDEGPSCDYRCEEGKFQCKNNHCIPAQLRCDQNEDCMDGSDELDCKPEKKTCTIDEFDCQDLSPLCISRESVCDGKFDCHSELDEDPSMCKETDPCRKMTCYEHSRCINLNNGTGVCECLHGFTWADGGCQDVNECEGAVPVCSQLCNNTKGGYKCDCYEGYILEGHWECRVEGEKPWLFYANRRDIRRLRVDTRYMEVIVEGTDNSIALDVDIHDNLVFWTDGAVQKIKSAHFNSTLVQIDLARDVIQTDIQSPDGIAVDWLYKNFYWTDSGTNTISVATYAGDKRLTVVSENLVDPRAICLDPQNGYMYWTDWGNHAKIERSGMNGQDRQTLLTQEHGLDWPNGLTIDYLDERLYWIDAKLHKIGSARLDGSGVRIVLANSEEIKRPFSISVFEDKLYWTDWSTNSIKSLNKLTGGSRQTLSIGSYSVMDIKVVHDLRQDKKFAAEAKSLCAAAACEYMCLPAASKVPGQSRVSCACEDGYQLNTDQRSCMPKPATQPPANTTAAPVATPKPGEHVPETTSNDIPKVSTAVPDVTTEEGGNQTQVEHHQPGSADQSNGYIAIITAVVVFVVVVIVALLGFVVYRRYSSRNKKSTSFDNPVYRKTTTTEEQCMIQGEEPYHHTDPMLRKQEIV